MTGAHNLIVGCGDTGVRIAARAMAAGDHVTGVVRSATGARRVRAVGAVSRQIDLDMEGVELPPCERLFYCAPPSGKGQHDIRMQHVIRALNCPPRHVVYMSTTGVYGDCGDALVTEDRPPAPASPRAIRRLDAERQLRAWCSHAVVLRIPGIYGPGRLPVTRVRDGSPVLADTDSGWTNRIHIDDLAAITWQAGQRRWPHEVYNVCDGRPTRMAAFYDALARMLDVSVPPRVDWATAQQQFSPARLSFLRESRYLSNARLRRDFGYRFAFADFRDGLRASLTAETS